MDMAQWLVTLGGITLIVLTLWFFFGKRRVSPPSSGAEKMYACPMHPWITSNMAGSSCSVCGMALVSREK